MKRILSLTLVLCMLGALMLPLVSCALVKTVVHSGTEAAKLLLANERLDESLLGSNLSFLSKFSISAQADNNDALGLIEVYDAGESTSASPRVSTLTATTRPTFTNTAAGEHTWKNFPAYSPSMVEYSQFVNSVERATATVAEEIAHMKNNVGITDKWVKVGKEWQMLRVYQDRDVLMVIGTYNDIHVYYRYTNENAKNVYELYSFMDYGDGTTANIKTLYIPGERCEHMSDHSTGFGDYFIAENSRGYWVNTRFSYQKHEDGSTDTAFFPVVIKDGLGYGAAIQTFRHGEQGEDTQSDGLYYVFDPAENRELFRINTQGDRYDFELYLDAIKDGFVSVTGSDVRYIDDALTYETDGPLSVLTTDKGSYAITPGAMLDGAGAFTLTDGRVQYDHSERFHKGYVTFSRTGSTNVNNACRLLGMHLGDMGLSLYCDMNTVAQSVKEAEELTASFRDTFSWNGFIQSDTDQAKKAHDLLQEQYRNARADYEAVKDYEQVSSRQVLSSDARFAALSILSNSENTFADGVLDLKNILVGTDDVALFESGTAYILQVGLSLVDEAGNPISVNTVSLTGTEAKSTVFTEGSITLSASGRYQIPLNLSSGRYAAVVYVATADEGIRVSEMKKLAFVDIREGEIESAAMLITATKEDSNLFLAYKISNTRSITLEATQDTYTVEELTAIITREILAFGAPISQASLETADGQTIDANATLGKGTYRMLCYINTVDGMAQGYVCLTVT